MLFPVFNILEKLTLDSISSENPLETLQKLINKIIYLLKCMTAAQNNGEMKVPILQTTVTRNWWWIQQNEENTNCIWLHFEAFYITLSFQLRLEMVEIF